MKKLIFSFVIALMTVFSVNAQTAIETPKFFDNFYVGIQGGATTPLDFNKTFPVNGVAGLTIGKELTPVFGVNVEGNAWFYDNHFVRSSHTFVTATNVSMNGTINFMNLYNGYKGAPRTFEMKTNTGLGWLHYWNCGPANALTAKTAIDFDFNVGKTKAHTFKLSPGVYWNLSETGKIQFNKQYAQFAVMVGYTYHFKTSNGTHSFKLYDVGKMNDEINKLQADLARKPKEVVKEVKVPVAKVIPVEKTYVIQFAQSSSLLTSENMEVLNRIPEGTRVNVVGTASVEGSKDRNYDLSVERANVVTNYLKDRRVEVVSSKGIGSSNGPTSNRLVIVTVAR